MGSTAANTGLIQYEIDTPMVKLQKKTGTRAAHQSYLWCNKAIYDLETVCDKFPDAEFIRKPSLQFASWKKDIPLLKEEYKARREIGLDVRLLDAASIKNKFGFKKEAGIISGNAAEMNAYGLTHSLLRYCCKKNLEVYDHTNIKTIHHKKKGFTLYTDEGYKIETRYIVIACGYESSNYIPKKINQLHSTYAIVSEPFDRKQFWYRNAVIWETATPYLYLRTTKDNRILMGGRDDDFSSGNKRDRALPGKAKSLEITFRKLFPHLPFKTDFKWAGLFSSTRDGLPYIGPFPGKKDIYFALGFGGNGIVFSVIAAQIIRDFLEGKAKKEAAIFGFSR